MTNKITQTKNKLIIIVFLFSDHIALPRAHFPIETNVWRRYNNANGKQKRTSQILFLYHFHQTEYGS